MLSFFGRNSWKMFWVYSYYRNADPPPSKWPVLIIISERKFQTMDFSQIRICRPDPPSVLIRFLWMVRCVLNNFFFFDFYFSSYEKFIENWVDEVTKNDQKRTITRKIEIGKIWNFIFPLIQPIPDVSCKFEHFTFHLNLKKKCRHPKMFEHFWRWKISIFLWWETSPHTKKLPGSGIYFRIAGP